MEVKVAGRTKVQTATLLGVLGVILLQAVTLLLSTGVLPSTHTGPAPRTTDNGHQRHGEQEPLLEGAEQDETATKITKSFYGRTKEGRNIHKFSFVNKNDLKLELITLGGTITKITAPCRHGHLRDIILGYDKPEDYFNRTTYFGSIIGRYANRIGRGQFTLDGQDYHLHTNDGRNTLHGGTNGWDKKVWKATQASDHVTLSYTSPDGDEHFPGSVHAKVTYQLTPDNVVIVSYDAHVHEKATPINLASHPYFNLGGEGNRTIYDHNVTVFADKYVEVDDELIPTGATPDVAGSLFDLTSPVTLGDVLNNVTSGQGGRGFDHSFVLRGPTGKKLAARVYHPRSGRIMEIYTNQPGLQFYTGNMLNVSCGKMCHAYGSHTGFTMETQNHPDAMNQPTFPDCVLRPGSTYLHQTQYKFTTDWEQDI